MHVVDDFKFASFLNLGSMCTPPNPMNEGKESKITILKKGFFNLIYCLK
jgi:hypothetical protein